MAAEWAQVIAGLGVFGEIGEDGWEARVHERGQLAGALVQAWMMLNAVMLVLYAHQREIPLERFVERSA